MSDENKNTGLEKATKQQITNLSIIKEEDKLIYYRQQAFVSRLNQKPNLNKITKKSVGQGKEAHSIPIGEIETMLDQDFFGMWKTSDFNTYVVANEIVGSIILSVWNPAIEEWITRVGAASVMIQTAKDKPVTLENKIKNTLEKDFPHLKAACIKNAAKGLGKKYGRDLDRNPVSDFVGQMTNKEELKKEKHNDLQS